MSWWNKYSESQIELAIANALAGGGGGGGLTNITYANLVSAINGSTLTSGGLYRITDFATTHYILKTSRAAINTGPTEPLIVLATSTSTVSHDARSETYPQDVIKYDWNPANWSADEAFATALGAPIAGFTGVIYFRHDMVQDVSMGYDFRAVKFRRWKVDAAAWSGATTYATGEFVTRSGFVYRSLADANTNHDPSGARTGWWVQLLDLSLTEYWNARSLGTNGVPSDVASFADFLTFVENGAGLYANVVRGVHIGTFKDDNVYFEFNGSILANNVFFLPDTDYYTVFLVDLGASSNTNTFGGEINRVMAAVGFEGNQVGNQFSSNTIGVGFKDNIIGSSFQHNVIDTEFQGNSIESAFSQNNISTQFLLNTLGADFSSNYIGPEFGSNIVGAHCADNTTFVNFNGNTIGDNFGSNTAENQVTGVDFTSGVRVYVHTYSKTLFAAEGGAVKLRYIDAVGAQQVVAPTD